MAEGSAGRPTGSTGAAGWVPPSGRASPRGPDGRPAPSVPGWSPTPLNPRPASVPLPSGFHAQPKATDTARLAPPARAPRKVDTGGPGIPRRSPVRPSGTGPARGGVRGSCGAAEAGLPFGPSRDRALSCRKRLVGRTGRGSSPAALGHLPTAWHLGTAAAPRHRPAGPRAQPWETRGCDPGTRLGLPRARGPVPGAVPYGPAPWAPPLSAGPVVALQPRKLIIAAQ